MTNIKTPEQWLTLWADDKRGSLGKEKGNGGVEGEVRGFSVNKWGEG